MAKPIKEYIVIGKKPIIVLPPDDEVPDPDDPENEQFAGWVTPGGDDVTPGHTPTPDEENVIVIRPSYSSDQAKWCTWLMAAPFLIATARKWQISTPLT